MFKMNLGEPTQLVTPTLDGPVLTVLAHAGEELTAGMVATRCQRGSEAGIRNVLARLAAQGIVSTKTAGNAVLYALNRDHVGAASVAALADLRLVLWRQLGEAIANWPLPAVSACVFGSAARGDGDEASDLDVLVVRPDDVAVDHEVWAEQLSTLSRAGTRWSGNAVQLTEFSEAELRDAVFRREPLITELGRDAIDLAGRPIREYLGAET